MRHAGEKMKLAVDEFAAAAVTAEEELRKCPGGVSAAEVLDRAIPFGGVGL
jgi:hypothetical protein